MMTAKLFIAFVVFGSLAEAAIEDRPSAPVYSDAAQTELLRVIDLGVIDYYPSLDVAGNWVIYPEDHPKIIVTSADRRITMEPAKIAEGEFEPEFGEDPDLDAVLVQ